MALSVRQSYWEDGLRTYLDRIAEEPFRWGENDCILFSAGAIRAMTGFDPASDVRGKYSTQRGAAEILRTDGAGTVLKTVQHWLGAKKPVSLAHRGDIIMKDRTTTGVCVGAFSAFIGEEQCINRMVFIPTRDCAYAFTVPYSV